MGLDIRWPIGLMFTLIGVLLTGYGAATGSTSVRLGLNINLIWGVVLLGFGILMLIGAVRGNRTKPDDKK